ncbi:hypothetical protein C5B97_04805 [Pseudoclavibacter sp. RFBB5]|nr:hypothetical protein C5B97_04805 [Pseudoclavibacter sp. RFBB5]
MRRWLSTAAAPLRLSSAASSNLASMRPKKSLPAVFDGRAFRYADARVAGLSRGHIRSSTSVGPHRGIRVPERITSPLGADLAYAASAPEDVALASVSACRVWGIPLPLSIGSRMHTFVAVRSPRHVPSGVAVTGFKLAGHLYSVREVDGVRALSPCVAWAQSAAVLALREVLVQADALLTRADNYPGRRHQGALATLDELRAVTAAWTGRVGVARLRAALQLVRPGSESPGESRLRFVLSEAGFAEPIVQHRVYDRGRFVARIDLSYPPLKIALEYDGEHHFTVAKAMEDIERRRELERLGWIVIQVTRRDIRDPSRLFARLRVAMLARSS